MKGDVGEIIFNGVKKGEMGDVGVSGSKGNRGDVGPRGPLGKYSFLQSCSHLNYLFELYMLISFSFFHLIR